MSTWATETFVPRVDIALKAGAPGTTSVPVLIASLSNAVANLNVNGVDYPITWVEVGADVSAFTDWALYPELGPVPTKAGYIAHITVTGLSPLTKYEWTLTQTGSDTNTGTLMTKPLDTGTDPFSLWFLSCDSAQTVAAATGWANGGYETIAEYIKADIFPLVSIMHLDDYGYLCAAGTYVLNDYVGNVGNAGDPDRSGLTQYDNYAKYAIGSGGEYCAAVAWFAYLNLTGYKTTLPPTWNNEATANQDFAIRSFSGEHRQYVFQNCNFCLCPGDWEYQNDLGWDIDSQGISGQQAYDTGRHVQDLFVAPLMPPNIVQNNGNDRGVDPLNFDITFGPVQIVSPDGVVNGTGAFEGAFIDEYTDPVTVAAPSEMVLGPKQIADVLAAFNNTKPFKILMMMYGMRYPVTPIGKETAMGSQHPLSDHFPHEYEPLFVKTGPPNDSIMANPNTNGTVGKFLCMHGDTHIGMHHTHRRSKAGLVDELFDSLYVGSVNAAGAHSGDDWAPVEGGSFDGTTLEQLMVDTSAGSRQYSSVRMDVRVDLDPIELHYYFYNDQSTLQPVAVFKQTADATDSALVRIDNMSKTFKQAYTPDAARVLVGNEILGATKQDAGDADTGILLDGAALHSDLRYLKQAGKVPSLQDSFSYKGVKTPVVFASDQGSVAFNLSAGTYNVLQDGSLYSTLGVASGIVPLGWRSTPTTNKTLFIVVGRFVLGSVSMSLGGNYYYYAAGFYFKHSNVCGITQTPNSAYCRFPAQAATDADTLCIMALYHDPTDQTNCRKFEYATRGGVPAFASIAPDQFGGVAMSGALTMADDFDMPKSSNAAMFGLYRLVTSDDLTTAPNLAILEAAFADMYANPNNGISELLSPLAAG